MPLCILRWSPLAITSSKEKILDSNSVFYKYDKLATRPRLDCKLLFFSELSLLHLVFSLTGVARICKFNSQLCVCLLRWNDYHLPTKSINGQWRYLPIIEINLRNNHVNRTILILSGALLRYFQTSDKSLTARGELETNTSWKKTLVFKIKSILYPS